MPDDSHKAASRYLVKSIVHASTILSSFRTPGEVLQLRDVVSRTGLNKGMCFRLLYTLHECGLVEKVGENRYRVSFVIGRQRRFRMGYADPDRASSFSQQVFDGLVRACQKAQIELIMVDNRRDSKLAVRNAQRLIREQVDVAVEFQINEAAAAQVASIFQNAGIPLIAVDIPHPGAFYFGADNHLAGLLGGRCLGHYATQKWQGTVDEVLLLDIARAGPLVRTRVNAMLAGLREVFPLVDNCRVQRLDSKGEFRPSLESVRKFLQINASKRTLVGAANDPGALGALRAFQECGRAANCAIIGQNAEPEARAEMRVAGTRLIGSVAFFPEAYGEAIVRLASDILSRKHASPATFTSHQLVTPENVDHFYPNDTLFCRLAREYA